MGFPSEVVTSTALVDLVLVMAVMVGGGLTEMIIGAVVVGFICDDFSTADLTISIDLSKLTSPIGGLDLFKTAVGLVLVLGFTTVFVCSTDKSTSDNGIFSSGTMEDCSRMLLNVL